MILERPMIVELIKLTLNHGVYSTRSVANTNDVEATIADWQPHLVNVDMDLDSTRIITLLSAQTASSGRMPVIGLTRRGDLRNKLAAFDAGVDDILTVPFAPDELLARVIALLWRAYSDAVTFTPVIKIGQLEIDILHRTVRAGTSELDVTSLEQSLLYLLAAKAGACSLARRSSTRCGAWTTWPKATSWTTRFGICSAAAGQLAAAALHATVPGRGYRFLPTFTDSALAVATRAS